ncbi:MAG TPA: sigma-70 family RNA polymerase sigma factor, partial [Kofleriaceae bacterium]|nr:sigma-70 family RNA polymerase sigma factor [Kofleriaceae bacterium]
MGSDGDATDIELLEASRRGEHEAFGRLVARYQDLVCAVSFSSTGDHVLSEDVAQETFIAAWRQLAGLREPARLRPWLCGIARNLARKARKARRRDELVDEGEPIAEGNPFDEAARGQVERLVRDALDRVPETYREVLVLFYRENQSIREVATALGTSEAAVMQRLSRGRRYLADGVTSLVERSLRQRGDRPRRDLVAAVLAAIAVTAIAPHVDANPRPKGPKGSTMLKLALAATATVAAGTTVYLLTAHHDTAPAAAKAAARQPALRLGAGKLGLAHAPALGPTAAPRQIASRSVADADLAYVPADADAVMGFNLAQLQKSALWQQFVAPHLADSPDMKSFATECGFDPMASVTHMTIGLAGLGGDAISGTIVVHGIDKAKSTACFSKRAVPELQKDGPHVRVDQDVVMIDSPDNTGHFGFMFVDDDTALFVIGPAAETRQGILDVAAGTHGLRGTPGFTDALADVNTDASAWAMFSDASPIVGSVNGAISPYTSQKLGTMYMSLNVTDAIALDAGVHLGSPADVAKAVATIQSKIDAIDPNKTLRQYFDQLDVFADGSDLIFSVAIAGNQLLPLAG